MESIFRDVLIRVEPEQLDLALQQWHKEHGQDDESLAIDGKTMKNAMIGTTKALEELNERDFENFLCLHGYTKKAAKTITSIGFKALQKDDGSYDLAELKGVIDAGINQLIRH